MLQLANVLDISSPPPNIQRNLPQPPARSSSLRVEEYALVALRLLDAAGTAGWLHQQWLKWSNENSIFLERLTQHSLELGYPLTPAAFPAKRADPNWHKQLDLLNRWKKMGQSNPRGLQMQLLQASSAARYPHAYLFKHLLTQEMTSSTPGPSWHVVWDTFLQQEMSRGSSATYQTCLHLRLLICAHNQAKHQEIADEVMVALSTNDQLQKQVLTFINNLYLMDFRDWRYSRYLRELIKKVDVIKILCNILKQQRGEVTSVVLFTLYNVVATYDDLPQPLNQHVYNTIKMLKRSVPLLTEEQDLLATTILRGIGVLPRSSLTMLPTHEPPDTRAINLYTDMQQQQQQQLTKRQVEEMLAACTDTRRVSEDVSEKVDNTYSVWSVAWKLLEQQFAMEPAALQYVVQMIDDDQAVLCGAAALLLRKRKELTPDMRKEAMQKIMAILGDGERSRRPLETPDYSMWRLDDVLFETLGVLAE